MRGWSFEGSEQEWEEFFKVVKNKVDTLYINSYIVRYTSNQVHVFK